MSSRNAALNPLQQKFVSVEEQYNRKSLTILAFLLFFIQAFNVMALPKTLYDIGLTYNLSGTQKGNLVSAGGLGFVLAALTGGYLSEIFGKKKVILVGLALAAAGNLFFGAAVSLAPVYFFLLGFTFLLVIGSGKGILEGLVNALVIHLQPERKGLFLNLAHAFYAVGAVVAPVVGGYLMQMGNWPSLYYFNAVLNAGLFTLLAIQKCPSFREGTRVSWRAIKNIAQNHTFVLLNLSVILCVGAEMGLVIWMAEYFRTNEHFLLSQMQSGLILSCFWIAMLVGRFLYGPLVEKISAGSALSISCVGGIGSILILILTGNLWLAVAMVILSGLFQSGMVATIFTVAGEIYPSFLGIVTGTMAACVGIGSAVFPNIMGRISDVEGLGLKTGIGTCALYLAGILIIVIRLTSTVRKTVDPRPQ